MSTWSEKLWGKNAKTHYLFVAAALLLFCMLGAREIWTQEHRWADIVSAMFYHHDFLHPSLGENDYYDKPLLSYWFIAAISWVRGEVTTWALRLPSALAGLLAVWSIYRLGTRLKNSSFGLLSGWLLLTTFYFIFWARTSSADMLNMAGSLFAVTWYFEKKSSPSFFTYAFFFLILAATSLCKGLVGAVVPVLVILPDIIFEKSWRKYFNLSLFLSAIPAIILYALPFWASNHFRNASYHENGLYEVYRENVLRYFQPFDHKGPIYTYLIYLPVYLFPWVIFFIPALFSLKSRWSSMSRESKWICWAVFILFVFFTLSGSRRNYYVLPMVPFAILLTADWILASKESVIHWAGGLALGFFVALFLNFDVVQPWYYSQNGLSAFTRELKTEATKIQPWVSWQFVMLDAESKMRFYLQLSPEIKNYPVIGKRQDQTESSLQQTWPLVDSQKPNVIFISRKQYQPLLAKILPQYQIVELEKNSTLPWFKKNDADAPIAFIPKVTS